MVGGHSRNIGKTSVICGIISGSPALNWTALKITQDPKHASAGTESGLVEELDPASASDSGRFLAAGARRAFFVPAPEGQFVNVIPHLRALMSGQENVIVESNSIVEFLTPDLFAMVLNGAVADFKQSSRRFLERADLLVLTSRTPLKWPGIEDCVLAEKPQFMAPGPGFWSSALNQVVLDLAANPHRAGLPAL